MLTRPWASNPKIVWVRAFKWGIIHPCRSRGCKAAGPQSPPPPGIEPGPWWLLHKIAKNVASNPKCQLFFWPQTLTVRSFATPWDTETYNTSLERSDVWLLSGYTFRGVAVLFRSATLPQSTPTLLHISAIVRRVMLLSVFSRVCNDIGTTVCFSKAFKRTECTFQFCSCLVNFKHVRS